jgi:threonine/homoserine/homoserine lactone efflux protein
VDLQLIAYLSFTAVLVLTPGSTTAVVVRNALIGGRRAGLSAAMGAAMGNTSHATAAGLGLAVVFSRWPLALASLTFAGAAYLGWLGARSVYRVFKHPDGGLQFADGNVPPRSDSDRRWRGTSFRQGLTVNLLNPAIATFYLVVLPSFLGDGASPYYFAALAAMHITMACACHVAWALALSELRRLFHPPLARRVLEGATGIALIALAIRVLWQ